MIQYRWGGERLGDSIQVGGGDVLPTAPSSLWCAASQPPCVVTTWKVEAHHTVPYVDGATHILVTCTLL